MSEDIMTRTLTLRSATAVVTLRYDGTWRVGVDGMLRRRSRRSATGWRTVRCTCSVQRVVGSFRVDVDSVRTGRPLLTWEDAAVLFAIRAIRRLRRELAREGYRGDVAAAHRQAHVLHNKIVSAERACRWHRALLAEAVARHGASSTPNQSATDDRLHIERLTNSLHIAEALLESAQAAAAEIGPRCGPAIAWLLADPDASVREFALRYVFPLCTLPTGGAPPTSGGIQLVALSDAELIAISVGY